MIRKICAGALAFMLGAVSLQSEASTQWLLDQQQPDGAIARPTDVAIPIQSTSEALAALRLLGAASPATAEGYVLTDAYDGTEYLARKIAANANNPAVVAPLVTSLLSHQGVDGGFAERSGFQSSTLDTALALDAMSSAGRGGEPAALSAASFLLQAQRSDGSWTNATDPEVYITALSARSLFALRDRIPAINSAIVKANAFLLSRRSTDALWGEDWLSAQALLTLATTAIDVSAFQQSGDALKARRLPDTSWSDDVYTTALSLRAMFVFDARRGGAPLPSSGGAVAGYVLRAGTSEAITGVTVTAGGGAHAQSNAEGYFTISGIGAGDQTLTLQKEGYASASKVVIVRAGQISNAGSIYLAQSVNEALVRGRIIDGLSGEALGGVVIALSGPMSRSATSNAAGEFEITALLPGTYSVSFTRTGYYAATGSLVAPAESVSEIRQGLVKEGAAQATGALDVSGRVVDASNGSALAGAVVRVDGSASTTASLGDGSFVLAALARGNHSVEISQSGFVTATYSFNLPPGASGALGNLALSPMTATQSPNSLTVVGHVIDGLDNRALTGASISVAQTGATVVADAQGNFVLSNLSLLSFDVSITADGHQGRTFALAASGYGEVSGTFALSPLGGDPLATASTLHGVVRDSVTATPLAGASLRISGTALSALSNDAGEFNLTGVALKEFDLLAALSGYADRDYHLTLDQHGTYTLEVTLTREPGAVEDLFDVVSVVPQQLGTPANTEQVFTARIANLTADERSSLIVADVIDDENQRIGRGIAFAPGTQTPTSTFAFAANQSLEVSIKWNTAQFAPGQYRIRVSVVEPGTVTRDLPEGVVLAHGETSTQIDGSSSIGGGIALNPPLAQAGATQPVHLSAAITNQGNQDLSGESFSLLVLDASGATTLHAAQATAGAFAPGNTAELDFGSWIPTQTGDLPIIVTAVNPVVTGNVNAVLYVGDKATGIFTVDRTVTPPGTQTVRGSITMRGVDVRTGVSTDPLFIAVREAVRKGGLYVGQEAPRWNETNRCLGCHIQAQSLMGLAGSLNKAPIDPAAVRYVYNDMAASQQGNGTLLASHPEFSSVTNSLGSWAMSGWPEPERAFRTQYRSAVFQLDTLGNGSFWTSNHCLAWWCNNDGPTMASVKGISGALEMAEKLNGATVPDFAFEPSHQINATTVMDFEQAPDGTLWYVTYPGVLYAKDLQTGTIRTVATGLPSTSFGLAIGADGSAYIAALGTIVRIAPDGTRSTLVSGSGFGYLADITFGADGFLYVSDSTNHRIYKVSLAGTVTTFATGGLLNNPVGLAFDPQGNLYVANYARYNIVRINPAGVADVFAPGLPYRPVWLRRGPDGVFYASHERFNNSGYTPPGIFRIDAQGYASRIFAYDSTHQYGYNTINFIGDSLYVTHEGQQRLYRMTVQPLATPRLADMRAALARVADHVIAIYNDNAPWNDIQAMRLITLAEARKHITDTVLIARIDTAINNIANLLRSRQRGDGGWGYTTSWTVSDPYATSFVGLALEYTNPSVNDPAIRSSITFLLNQQQADFSWLNQNSVFTTRLGPTSFVMAYLPVALERLGGIDTDLTLVMPSNATLSNPSQPPTSQTPVSDGTQYLWSLRGVTANARTISFDVTLPNLLLPEQRPVAAQAYLAFNNSFTDERIRSDLAIPTVQTASQQVLTLATDQPVYPAQADVAITGAVMNAGGTLTGAHVHLIVRAGDGALVADLGNFDVGTVASGAMVNVPATWNTGNVLVGGYQAYGQLYNAADVLVSEAATSFQVQHAGGAASASITTDKPVYQAWDTVNLAGRLRNLSDNVLLAANTIDLQVRSPAGEVIFTRSFPGGAVSPRALRDVAATLALSDAASGDYAVELVAKDSFSAVTIATAATQFAVARNELQALRGQVTVQNVHVERGATNICTDRVNNAGAAALSDVVFSQTVVNLDSGTAVQSSQQTATLSGGQHQIYLRNVATASLAEGTYACVLTASYAGRTQQLGSAAFDVSAPPIRIATTVQVAKHGRVLILVDKPASAKDASDPFSGCDVPDLNVQRAHLTSVLDAARWTYKIVQTATDFDREFHTGGYEVYAIFSEEVKLAVSLQDEVVSAVSAGAGLLVAGNHDRRNSKLETALGIMSQGKNLSVQSLIVSASDVMDAGEENITVEAEALEMKLQGASAFGRYRLIRPRGNPESAAATRFAYGQGKSIYVGFDLIMAGAASGDDSLFAELLTHALDYVHPQVITPRVNGVLPLQIQLRNEGVQTPGRVLLKLPTGTSAFDNAGATVLPDGTLSWSYSLAPSGTLTVPLWVKLPTQPADVSFNVRVQTGVAPDYLDYDQKTLTLRASPR